MIPPFEVPRIHKFQEIKYTLGPRVETRGREWGVTV